MLRAPLLLALLASIALADGPSQKGWAASINFAGRRRMLAQKAAKEIFQVQLKVDGETHRSSLQLSADDLARVAELNVQLLEEADQAVKLFQGLAGGK